MVETTLHGRPRGPEGPTGAVPGLPEMGPGVTAEVLHWMHRVNEVLGLGMEIAEGVGAELAETVAFGIAQGASVIAGTLLSIVVFGMQVARAGEAGMRWGRVVGGAYGIVTTACGRPLPAPPASWPGGPGTLERQGFSEGAQSAAAALREKLGPGNPEAKKYWALLYACQKSPSICLNELYRNSVSEYLAEEDSLVYDAAMCSILGWPDPYVDSTPCVQR